ncbi:tetratricopeptide repeat protein [Geodermatophilus sp. SYSU D00766]
MRRPRTQDDLAALHHPGQTPDDSRAMARRLEAWAEEGTRAGDEVNTADLLVAAGEQLVRVGDTHDAVRVLRRAVGTGEPVEPDVRCYLHHALLQAGDVDAARALAEEVRRERPSDGDVYLFIGEDYELHGDLREAHRWLTMGTRRALGDVEDTDEVEALDAAREAAHLLVARRRVRRELGMAPDDWDELVPELPYLDDDPLR